jgi:hypothetical protein
VGKFDIYTGGGSPGLYIEVPKSFTVGRLRPSALPSDALCRWVLPQLEYAGNTVAELPDAYSGDWIFDKISGE